MLSSPSGEVKLFPNNFSKNSHLDDSGMPLPAFPSRINLKQYRISLTLKSAKKAITKFDSSKASGLDFISVVVIKNCSLNLHT